MTATLPKIEYVIREANGMRYREPKSIPAGFTLLASHTPQSSPWDCYGRRWVDERTRACREAGIEVLSIETQRTRTNPMGSGPGGRVRFGDDMCPSLYELFVRTEEHERALQVLQDLAAAVTAWLNREGPMPDALKG